MLGLDRYRNVTEYKVRLVSVCDKSTVSCIWEGGGSANNVRDRVETYSVTLTFHQEPTS